MITLFGGLLGLFTSAMPELLRFVRTWQDHRFELAMAEVQIRAQRELASQRLEEVRVQSAAAVEQAMSAEQVALIQAQRPVGIAWVDALSATVRPSVTYLFVLTYVGVKVASFHLLAGAEASWSAVVVELWDEQDGAVLGAILGYWFGARMLARHRQGAN